MIRFQSTLPQPKQAPEPVQGVRFELDETNFLPFDFNDVTGIFGKHSKTGIITHRSPAFSKLPIVHVRSATELLTIRRDFNSAVLDESFVTYGNHRLRFNAFFITPTYDGGEYDNGALADMVIRLMHRGKRSVACALEVTSDAWQFLGKTNEILYNDIRIRDTKSGQHRIVIPKAVIDNGMMKDQRTLIDEMFMRPGTILLSGIASLQTDVRAQEGVYYIRFHIRNMHMVSSEAHLPIGEITRPEDWVKNGGLPAASPAQAFELPPSFY